jgi:hypothetical protein
LYKDASFPAAESFLWWTENKDSKMGVRYKKDIDGWVRPKDLENGDTPDLWGSQGIRPAAIR